MRTGTTRNGSRLDGTGRRGRASLFKCLYLSQGGLSTRFLRGGGVHSGVLLGPQPLQLGQQ